MVRKILGPVIGIIVANLVIFGWEWIMPLISAVGALPPGEPTDPGYIAAMPLAPKLWVVAGWGVGAFAGALAAWLIGKWEVAGWIVGALVAAAGIANVMMLDHPLWMQLCAVAAPFVGALFAYGVWRRSVTLARRRTL